MKNYSKSVKLRACEDYKNGVGTFTSIGRKIGSHRETVRQWWLKYENVGESAFDKVTLVQNYPDDIRSEIINKYLEGNESAKVIGAKYNINGSTIINWINKYYYSNEDDSTTKGDNITMKSKKTTFEERLEIVSWVIDNKMNSKEASRKFDVNYTTIRGWVEKYLKDGSEGLVYKKRGKKVVAKDIDSLSEIDKLKYELEKERELRKQREFEIEVLKKKEEFEKKNRYRR